MSSEIHPQQQALGIMAKRELRKRIKLLRATIPHSARDQRSTEIVTRLTSHPVWQRAKTVALFQSMQDEVQLYSAIELAKQQGKRVALPVVQRDKPLVFRAPYDIAHEQDRFTVGPMGILEPSEKTPEVPLSDIDLIVVPALGVDEKGQRIGYGKGHYDRTLADAKHSIAIAVVFDFQLLADVPVTEHDVPVHCVITDRQVIEVSPQRWNTAST